MFLPQKFSLKFKTWASTFVASFLLVGFYVCYSISLRPYPNDAMRFNDMTTCFFYGGFIGGWLGVLGLWFTLASWQCLADIFAPRQNAQKNAAPNESQSYCADDTPAFEATAKPQACS